ncbi:pseudouridine synthase [Cryptosporidium sp. chipmunk genotype I]|uniref:pseudouridine synthase n=1 Tax=Cryptosporidium sp. chipmunk genotype I TaxID=1280935 RepID=UPI00351A49C4|nr:pseudouridine synthase [Cryptosporidium sp. chipmunk genotype I]
MNSTNVLIRYSELNIEISLKDAKTLKIKKRDCNGTETEDYVIVVPPYMFEYESFCKLRWRDRTLRDLFLNEFRTRPIEEYQRLIDQRRLSVNDAPVDSLDYIVRNGDKIKHRSLFIELPAGPDKVKILYESSNILAVFKPCGIPCHPQGRFNKLSLTKIIQSEYLSKLNIKSTYIHPINRLDRVTSGLVLLSKDSLTTKTLSSRVQFAHKYYLAMINESSSNFISHISQSNIEGVSIRELSPDESHGITSHVIKCEIGLKTLKDREGESLITSTDNSENSKYSLTYFFPLISGSNINQTKRQKTNKSDEHSILLCKPITGRTHQIRAHLKYIGFPIVQDVLYNNISPESEPNISCSNFTNSNLFASCIYNLKDLEIEELLEYSTQRKYFAGGGSMSLNSSDGPAYVEYLVEPPIGICLHSLLYILPPSLPTEKYLIFKCEILPKWIDENTNSKIVEILKDWPYWNKSLLNELKYNRSSLL